jgi:hypothetical protein
MGIAERSSSDGPGLLGAAVVDGERALNLKVLRENRGSDGKGIVWRGWGVAGMAESLGAISTFSGDRTIVTQKF